MKPGLSFRPQLDFRGSVWLIFLCWPCLCSGVDWPQYRGPNHNGVSTERINKQWIGSVTNPIWRVFLTNGLTSITISGGRAFTQVASDLDMDGLAHTESCVALSITNGAILWSTQMDTSSNPLYPDFGVTIGVGDDGPRSTPVVDGGSVFVLSSYLKLYRLNATNGAIIWSTNLLSGFGGSVIRWQNAASPVLEDGLIFVNANAPSNALMAFNAANGTLVWRSQNDAMTHSTPVLTTMNGVRQLIFATQKGLVSLDPQTGGLLWRTNFPFNYSTSLATSPAVYSNLVFIAGHYSQGSVAYEITFTNSTHVPRRLWWKTTTADLCHWSTPVCFEGCVIGPFTPDHNTAQLRCVDMRTGTQNWAANDFGRGGVLLVDGHLLIITERGQLVLAKANTNAYVEVGRFLAIPGYFDATNKCWNAPAVSDGKVYVRGTAYAAAFDLSLPDLKLDPPKAAPANKVELAVRTSDGTPLNSNRLPGITLRATTNLIQPRDLWTTLSNTLTLTNGVARATNVDALPQPRFFTVGEPK